MARWTMQWTTQWRLALAVIAMVSTTGFSFQSLFAPKADLWAKWQAHDSKSDQIIDHSRWTALLERYVKSGDDGINRVAYADIAAADRGTLDGYIDTLSKIPIRRYSRDEQFAYWVNLYNAITVKVILDHYPVDSIRDIDLSSGLFSDGPWDTKLVTIEGEQVSLNDIEHRILRPIWRDPRVHYAVNCASIGCPNLRAEAYLGSTLEDALDESASAYINQSRGAQVRSGKLMVSSIYVWFADDFGDGSDEAIIEHLQSYAHAPLNSQLSAVTSIADHAYDWALNDATPSGH